MHINGNVLPANRLEMKFSMCVHCFSGIKDALHNATFTAKFVIVHGSNNMVQDKSTRLVSFAFLVYLL
jgi:hypothetical protein